LIHPEDFCHLWVKWDNVEINEFESDRVLFSTLEHRSMDSRKSANEISAGAAYHRYLTLHYKK